MKSFKTFQIEALEYETKKDKNGDDVLTDKGMADLEADRERSRKNHERTVIAKHTKTVRQNLYGGRTYRDHQTTDWKAVHKELGKK